MYFKLILLFYSFFSDFYYFCNRFRTSLNYVRHLNEEIQTSSSYLYVAELYFCIMKKILFFLCILFFSIKSYAQYDNVCDAACVDFNNLMEAFLQLPTEQMRNEKIYNQLEELQNIIKEIHVSQEERYKLNSLLADINVVKEFMSPISNKYNAHLSNSNMERLQTIFGRNFVKIKLNVKCSSDEVEFIEVKLGNLIVCYFHCISKKVENGLRIKYHAISGNTISSGEYGAMKNKYTPILHNAGEKYLRINSATIIERF